LHHLSAVTTDLPVLAIDTGQVAPAEENIAYSLFPAYGRFLSLMDANGTDIETCIASTYPLLTG